MARSLELRWTVVEGKESLLAYVKPCTETKRKELLWGLPWDGRGLPLKLMLKLLRKERGRPMEFGTRT